MITELDARSREVFRLIVDEFVAHGEPVGSRAVARSSSENLSPATIRNVMSDLVDAGLLYAPHTSAGRLPTQAGLRFFVDGLLEVGNLTASERQQIEQQCGGADRGVEQVLGEASKALSGLAKCAGVVVAPKVERPFKHVEFVPLSPGRALVIVVTDDGMVQNRIIQTPIGMSASTLVEAGNFLTARLGGRRFSDAQKVLEQEIEARRGELDDLTAKVVEAGLATWAGDRGDGEPVLILKGHAHLLGDVSNLVELERVRQLFDSLERQKSFSALLELTHVAEGVQIYIGSETETFGLSGCSVVVSPYNGGGDGGVVGAIGVIGPTRMNYAHIVPMVDYTARVVSRLLGGDEIEAP